MERKPIKKELNLFLGYTCNNNCWFCSEMANKGKPDKTTVEVKRELHEARRNGVQRITFTGGEPTIRKDIIELVSYAKKLGFEEIFIITNGRMLYYKEFARKLSEAGLTHLLFSLHSPKAKIHDYLTRSPGSFNQTVLGIKNTVEVGGIIVENNTVITKKNYKELPQLAEMLVALGVDFYEFILLNPYTINSFFKDKFEEFVPKVSQVAEYVHRAIDVGIKSNVWCTAEGIPFCYMKGYEKYVTELYMAPQRIIIGPGGRYVGDVNKSRREQGKVKASSCLKCKYNSVCEGLWGHYAEHYGTDELKPVVE
ncbi:MAG: radical SAM protein [Candidatus Micrarchaeia archaeon]